MINNCVLIIENIRRSGTKWYVKRVPSAHPISANKKEILQFKLTITKKRDVDKNQ